MATGGHRLPELRILMIGKTGHGKSSTGNSILGDRLFEVSNSSTSCTKDAFTKENERFGYTVRVTDTPGLFDTNVSHEQIRRVLMKCLFTTIPGIDAILFVLKRGEKFTRELQDTQRLFFNWFGLGVERFSFLVITDCNSTEEAIGYIKDRPHDTLTELASQCGNRILPINNRSQSNEIEAQVRFMIDSLVKQKQDNGGQSFKDFKSDLVCHIARAKDPREVSQESLNIMEYAERDVERFLRSEGFKILSNRTTDDNKSSVSPERLYPVTIIDMNESTRNYFVGNVQTIEESQAQQLDERIFDTVSRDPTNDNSLNHQSPTSSPVYQDMAGSTINDSNDETCGEYTSSSCLSGEADEYAADIAGANSHSERHVNEMVLNNQRLEGERLCSGTTSTQTNGQQHVNFRAPVPDENVTTDDEISGRRPRRGHSRKNRTFGPNPGMESRPTTDASSQNYGTSDDVEQPIQDFRENANTSETFFQSMMDLFKRFRIRQGTCSIL